MTRPFCSKTRIQSGRAKRSPVAFSADPVRDAGRIRRLRCEPLEDRCLLSMGDLLQTLADPGLPPQPGAGFGYAIAMTDQYLVVGAEWASFDGHPNIGRAYVYNAGTGDLVATLEAPSPWAYDYFGCSVAISGNTVVVGANGKEAGRLNSGAAYVFDAATGDLLFALANPAPAEFDRFGSSVAVSGNTIVVGVQDKDIGATDAGAAYVYDATTGNLVATLANPAPATSDFFGNSVAVSGSTIVVGAKAKDTIETDAGAAYVFDATTGNLLRTLAKPVPWWGAQFGSSVAISGNTVVVGAQYDYVGTTGGGATYVFDAPTGNLLQTLANPTPGANDCFGNAVAVAGNTIAVAAFQDGAAPREVGTVYIFDAATGSLLRTLANPTPTADDRFGYAVTVSGSTVAVGAYAIPKGGTVNVFDAATGNLLRTLFNSLPSSYDFFGTSVAVSGNTVVVGARYDSTHLSNSGTVYLYDAATGAPLRTLANPTPANDDYFGETVAMSGNTIVVGAYGDNVGIYSLGTAYVFDAVTGNLLHTLSNPNPAYNGKFGCSVAISGNTIVVGDYVDDPAGAGSGAVYVFDATTGNLLRTLLSPTPAGGNYFGCSVAVSGNTIVVGAQWDDTGALDSGSAYVFDATTGNLLRTFVNPTPVTGDYFGCSVAVSGNTVVVGAYQDGTAGSLTGSAYVYDATTGNLLWTLANPVPWHDDRFGYSVAASGDTIIVGAAWDLAGGTQMTGTAYVYDAATGNLLQTINNPNPGYYHQFSYSVSLSGSSVMIGSPSYNGVSLYRGAAYIFDVNRGPTDLSLSATDVAENRAAGTTVGELTTVDPNGPGESHTYTLVAGDGDADNAQFTIVGDQLKTAASFDYETKTSYSIRVRTTDAGGLSFEKAFTISVTDVDDFDRIAVGFGGSNGTWLWKAPGMWTALHGLTPVWIVSGDLDGNGKADLVVNFGGSTGIWIFKDTGTWQYLHPAASSTAAMADIDGDNRAELILTTSQAGIAGVWAYDATLNTWTGLAGWQAESFAVGDFDGNGKQDVVVDFGEGKGVWFWNNNTAWQYVHNVNPGWMAAGDLDGNGKTDLAVSVTGANDIWARLDSGVWQFIKSMANSTATTADANGDGRAELFVSITDPVYAGLWEYSMTASSWKYTTNWRPENLTSADVDGNGKKDVVADFGTNGLWIYKNNATWQWMHSLNAQVMTGTQYGQALLADTAVAPQSLAFSLTTADLDPIVAEAKRLWNYFGDFAANVSFEIADLPEGVLGETIGSLVLIDRDAAGYGWSLNLDTPESNRMDLLTVVMHELGHTVGLTDLDGSIDDLMAGRLKLGIRR